MTSVGNDVVYFHPNPDKIITEATQMRLNANYRLEETFEYIRDVRAAGTVDDEDQPKMSDRLDKNYFGRLITSGMHSPMDLMYQGNVIASDSLQSMSTYLCVGVLYLILTLPLSYYMRYLEKKLA